MRPRTIPAGLATAAALLLATAPFASAAVLQDPDPTQPDVAVCADAEFALGQGRTLLGNVDETDAAVAGARASAADVLDNVPASVKGADDLLDGLPAGDKRTALTQLRTALVAQSTARAAAVDVDLDVLQTNRDQACTSDPADEPSGEPAPTPSADPTPGDNTGTGTGPALDGLTGGPASGDRIDTSGGDFSQVGGGDVPIGSAETGEL